MKTEQKPKSNKVTLAVGLPVSPEPKAAALVPKPKPSKAQIIEALTTLKVEEQLAKEKAFEDEWARLKQAACDSLCDDLSHVSSSGKLLDCLSDFACPGNNCDLHPYFLKIHFSATTVAAIAAAEQYGGTQNPAIKSPTSRYYHLRGDDLVKHFRNEVKELVNERDGTSATRLLPLLRDKTFRESMSNLLAELEGRPVIES